MSIICDLRYTSQNPKVAKKRFLELTVQYIRLLINGVCERKCYTAIPIFAYTLTLICDCIYYRDKGNRLSAKQKRS